MAWKSSQPRRSAALKSDRLSFRMTVWVGSPNACGSGPAVFSKYWVAMAAPPLLVPLPDLAHSPPAHPPSYVRRSRWRRVRQIRFNEKELCRTTAVATGVEILSSLAGARQHSRLGELYVFKDRWFVALQRHWRQPEPASI